MILDSQLILSEDQVITATTDSTDVIDLGVANPNIGRSNKIGVHCQVSANFATCDSVTPKLQHSDDNITFVDLVTFPTVLVAALLKGKVLMACALPQSCMRYVKAVYTVAGSNATTGKVNCSIGSILP